VTGPDPRQARRPRRAAAPCFGIKEALQLPVRYIGTGEQLEMLEVFDPEAFVDAIVGK